MGFDGAEEQAGRRKTQKVVKKQVSMVEFDFSSDGDSSDNSSKNESDESSSEDGRRQHGYDPRFGGHGGGTSRVRHLHSGTKSTGAAARAAPWRSRFAGGKRVKPKLSR